MRPAQAWRGEAWEGAQCERSVTRLPLYHHSVTIARKYIKEHMRLYSPPQVSREKPLQTSRGFRSSPWWDNFSLFQETWNIRYRLSTQAHACSQEAPTDCRLQAAATAAGTAMRPRGAPWPQGAPEGWGAPTDPLPLWPGMPAVKLRTQRSRSLLAEQPLAALWRAGSALRTSAASEVSTVLSAHLNPGVSVFSHAVKLLLRWENSARLQLNGHNLGLVPSPRPGAIKWLCLTKPPAEARACCQSGRWIPGTFSSLL